MLFNSFGFLIFFPVVTVLYFLLPHKFRWQMLLASSCYFYMSFVPGYIVILGATITADYFLGRALEKHEGKRRKTLLVFAILVNVGVLFVFKYFNFFNANMAQIAHFFHWNYPIQALRIILPIGLSFHTFQSLSYLIEVYRGNQRAETDFGIFALFVMFYPQLVAGPIERPQNMLHQFHEVHHFDMERVADGLKQMLWGMFKKVVIADRLCIYVNQVYNHPHQYAGLPLVVATVFFGFQIYCDFSGYSDIAIGAAKVMGFQLMTNFDKPYLSASISEFWRRWHISLSTWFKDYVYIPMGGNRVPRARMYFNLFVTFFASGLWHGASWNYVLWGSVNGIYLIVAQLILPVRKRIGSALHLERVPRLHKVYSVCGTLVLIMFSWIFFRANTLHDAVYIITHLGLWGNVPAGATTAFSVRGLRMSFALIAFLAVVEIIQYQKVVIRRALDERLQRWSWVVYYAGIFAILLLGEFTKTQFIYFQF